MRSKKEVVMVLAKLTEYLDSNHINYAVIDHSPAYTAQGVAERAHISGKELAKAVMIRLNGELAMVVLPAKFNVDLVSLRKAIRARTVELAMEEEFQDRFPQCETGAMPPFGNLFGLPVYADDSLEKDKEIAFNAGTHRDLIRMAWEDFKRLVAPTMICCAAGVHAKAA
jgi:Ala-tRNA(Pro) deacylase